jgi:hypothetical protein
MTDTSTSGDQTVPNPDLEGYDPNTGRQEKLPEDNDTPAAYANEVVRQLPPDHPAMDSNIDPHEAYDVGPTTSSGVRAQDEVEDDKNQALYGGQ